MAHFTLEPAEARSQTFPPTVTISPIKHGVFWIRPELVKELFEVVAQFELKVISTAYMQQRGVIAVTVGGSLLPDECEMPRPHGPRLLWIDRADLDSPWTMRLATGADISP